MVKFWISLNLCQNIICLTTLKFSVSYQKKTMSQIIIIMITFTFKTTMNWMIFTILSMLFLGILIFMSMLILIGLILIIEKYAKNIICLHFISFCFILFNIYNVNMDFLSNLENVIVNDYDGKNNVQKKKNNDRNVQSVNLIFSEKLPDCEICEIENINAGCAFQNKKLVFYEIC